MIFGGVPRLLRVGADEDTVVAAAGATVCGAVVTGAHALTDVETIKLCSRQWTLRRCATATSQAWCPCLPPPLRRRCRARRLRCAPQQASLRRAKLVEGSMFTMDNNLYTSPAAARFYERNYKKNIFLTIS